MNSLSDDEEILLSNINEENVESFDAEERKVNELCYVVLSIVKLNQPQGIVFVLERITFENTKCDVRWSFRMAWIGKKPDIYFKEIKKTTYPWLLSKYTLKKSSKIDEYFFRHCISKYEKQCSFKESIVNLDNWNCSEFTVANIPETSIYEIGVKNAISQFELFKYFITPKKFMFPPSHWHFGIQFQAEMTLAFEKLKPTLPRRNILLLQAQLNYQNATHPSDQKTTFARSFTKLDILDVQDQFLESNNITSNEKICPIYFLMGLCDMKDEQNPALQKIGTFTQSIMMEKHNISSVHSLNNPDISLLPVATVGTIQEFWNESIKEATEFCVEDSSLALNIRKLIRKRQVSDESVRAFLNELCIITTTKLDAEMFEDIVQLSSLLYNWFRFAK